MPTDHPMDEPSRTDRILGAARATSSERRLIISVFVLEDGRLRLGLVCGHSITLTRADAMEPLEAGRVICDLCDGDGTRETPRTSARLGTLLVVGLGALLSLTGCGGGGSSGGGSGGGGSGGGGAGAANAARPMLASIDPDSGPAGRAVTLSGKAFTAGSTVRFDGVRASVRSTQTDRIICDVPAGLPAGRVSVTVRTAGGTSNGVDFIVQGAGGGGAAAPSIVSVAPEVGPPGTRVEIRGADFAADRADNDVTFAGTTAIVESASPDRLVVTVPAGAPSGSVVVTTAGGPSNGVRFFRTGAVAGNAGPSGALARNFIDDATFDHLVVEVDLVVGRRPGAAALDLLKRRIEERCRKPGGVLILVDDEVASPGIASWRVDDVRAFEAANRDHFGSGNTAVLYIAALDGGFEGDSANSRILGISYSGSSFCLFEDNIDFAATPVVGRAVIEGAVIVHELGHNLGLVGNGIPEQRPHQDAANPAHDIDDACVMFHAIETSLVSQLLGTVPDDFDPLCVEDLRAVGGR